MFKNLKSSLEDNLFNNVTFNESDKQRIRNLIENRKKGKYKRNKVWAPLGYSLSFICITFILIFSLFNGHSLGNRTLVSGSKSIQNPPQPKHSIIDQKKGNISLNVESINADITQTVIKVKVKGASALNLVHPYITDEKNNIYNIKSIDENGRLVFEGIPEETKVIHLKVNQIGNEKDWDITIPVNPNHLYVYNNKMTLEENGNKLDIKKIILSNNNQITLIINTHIPFNNAEISNGQKQTELISSELVNPKDDEFTKKLTFESLDVLNSGQLTLTLDSQGEKLNFPFVFNK